ncbi:MAG: hypothetical protein ABII23_00635 [bacterium]
MKKQLLIRWGLIGFFVCSIFICYAFTRVVSDVNALYVHEEFDPPPPVKPCK